MARDEKGQWVPDCPPHEWGPRKAALYGPPTRACVRCSAYQIGDREYGTAQVRPEPVAIQGLWVRNDGDKLQVLIERDGAWYLVAEEVGWAGDEGEVSHIVELTGLLRAPMDPLTKEST